MPLVLIADRDPSVRALQEHFLTHAGYVVEFADDGEIALELARTIQPQLIVTEILLPKIDGLSLCRLLRDDPLTREIPVMVFTILASAGRAREAGATAFLRKPFVDSIFVPAVQGLVASQPTAVLEAE
jgi:two-component system alkaline phosphatase synthesis response regulator PhoP